MESRLYVEADGTERWLDEDGAYHRLDGPAYVHPLGYEAWWKHGRRHRIGGPAVSRSGGTKLWYVDGVLHRIDGPAVIRYDGSSHWCVNGNYITDEVKEWMREQNVTCPFDEPTQMMFLMTFG